MNGPFLDCTLLRNHLAHWLYRSTGRYSVKTRHAVVYMRTDPIQETPKYAGIFLLLEKPTYDKNHVNLASMDASCAARDPKVLSGGWGSNDSPSYGSYSPKMVIDQYQNEFGIGGTSVVGAPERIFTLAANARLLREHRHGIPAKDVPCALEQHDGAARATKALGLGLVR
ncbi:hypothetical protein DVH05_020067 [Phytophthora capsici]|nr:hypothetical protein DVH05_020067 [Phytophthora capsici]